MREFAELLEGLPVFFDEMYDKVWQQILSQQNDVDLAKAVLTWVCFATEDMTVIAIRHALASSASDLKAFDDYNLIEEDQLESSCNGVVQIEKESRKLRFVHYTAKEYFTSRLEKEVPTAQQDISTSCIHYLSLRKFGLITCSTPEEIRKELQQWPLLGYASRNWGVHAKNSPEGCLQDLILGFLKLNENLGCAIRVMISTKKSSYMPNLPAHVEGLHVASFFGLTEIASHLVISGSPVDAIDSNGWTSLRWAAYGDQIEMAGWLIAEASDVDKISSDGNTTLMWTLGRHSRVTHYHDITICDNEQVHLGDIIMTEALDGSSFHAVNGPPMRSSDALVDLLIDNTKHIDTRENDGRTALSLAAGNQQFSITQKLIARGADINSQDKRGMNALLWALQFPRIYKRYSHLNISGSSVVHLGDFISIHPTEGPRTSKTDHVVLSQYNQSHIIRLIGKDLEAKDFQHRTALSLAAENGHDEVVRELLHSGADVNAQDHSKETVLMWASRRPCFQILILEKSEVARSSWVLLGQWMDFYGDAAEDRMFTRTQFPTDKNIDIVTVLIASGADKERKNAENEKALDMARADGLWDIAQLLDPSARPRSVEDLDFKDVSGFTRLRNQGTKGVITKDRSSSIIGDLFRFTRLRIQGTKGVITQDRSSSIIGDLSRQVDKEAIHHTSLMQLDDVSTSGESHFMSGNLLRARPEWRNSSFFLSTSPWLTKEREEFFNETRSK